MKYEWLDEYLLSFKGAHKDFKAEWNWTRYLIRDKMFAAFCYNDETKKLTYITLKCEPIKAEFLRSQYKDIIPGYYMNKVHWNSIAPDGDVPDELMREMAAEAYRLILGGFSKKVQTEIAGE